MKIMIGKAADNDFVADHAEVSRHHACLVREDDGGYTLEDLGSTNGTFVNDVQIVRKRIAAGDRIRLGDSYEIKLKDLLNAANDYSEEFAALKPIYDNYIREKIRIQSSNQFKTRLFQALPFAIPGIIGVLIGFAGKGSATWFAVSLLITVCAPIIGIYFGAKQSAKIPEQLQELTNRFKIDYVCPKCGTFLGEIPWESLKRKKQCPVPTCRARWSAE